MHRGKRDWEHDINDIIEFQKSCGHKTVHLCLYSNLIYIPEAESKEIHGVWDPMPELTVILKVPKCEIFHLFDSNDFYVMKSF
jgi:hypothetical protein